MVAAHITPGESPAVALSEPTSQTLASHQLKELLRLVVVGSVDDGKSTLIGRMLYECNALPQDQIAAVRRRARDGSIDFSLFTDGLLAEREQGITIDVAYRYFSTARRNYIVADTPGHEQYTRNMATGASTADAAVILVDARQGVVDQTRRHAAIAHLLGIPHLAIAINKMDLVGYSRDVFDRVAAQANEMCAQLQFEQVQAFAIAAPTGKGIVRTSDALHWQANALLPWLEQLPTESTRSLHSRNNSPARMIVQQILRLDGDIRYCAGRLVSGRIATGDTLVAYPGSAPLVVHELRTPAGVVDSANSPQSIALRAASDVDIGRGALLCSVESPPTAAREFVAKLIWLGDQPLVAAKRYLLKSAARTIPAMVHAIHHRLDVHNLEQVSADTLKANDIGEVAIKATTELYFDTYRINRRTGSFILIDPETNATVAAGMIERSLESTPKLREKEPTESDVATPIGASKEDIARAAAALPADDLHWLAGYIAALLAPRADVLREGRGSDFEPKQPGTNALRTGTTELTDSTTAKPVTILFGTSTGNSQRVAHQLATQINQAGQGTRILRISDYNPRELANEQRIVIVIATHGDGDPADDSRAFLDYLRSKRAPKLSACKYAILGLGDSSYAQFCAVARQVDARFGELGATALVDRGECDVDIETVAVPWSQQLVAALGRARKASLVGQSIRVDAAPSAASVTGKQANSATLLSTQSIVARGADKQVVHLEFAPTGEFAFQPGDAALVLAPNPQPIIAAFAERLGVQLDQAVTHAGTTKAFADWLTHAVELTRLSRPVLAALVKLRPTSELAQLLLPERQLALAAYLQSHQILDAIEALDVALAPAELLGLLRPLAPRAYSIASCPLAHQGEVHLTVAAATFTSEHGKPRLGACSNALALAQPDDTFRFALQSNSGFHLPDPSADIIMIGPGTGVAPFRGFVAHRRETGAKGRNWLFFGERSQRSTFLYQLEWQAAVKSGDLARIDLAFSRDGANKVYVQHRIVEQGSAVFDWIESGAHVYLCGDAKHMAPAVEQALLAVARSHGGHSDDGSRRWFASLREQGRYHKDVY